MSVIWIINQYSTTPETGIAGRHHYLARELGKRGHKVYLVSALWHHLLRVENEDDLPEVEAADGYTMVRIPVPRYPHAHHKKRILNWFLFRLRLAKLPKRIPERPDAILYSSPSLVGYPGAKRLARKLGARLVFEVRDIWPLSLQEIGGASDRHPFIRYLQRIEDDAYQSADAVVSNLPNAVDHMVSRGMDRAKFTWVPNGFSRRLIEQKVPLDDVTLKALPNAALKIGYTGTFGAANNLDILLDAAKQLVHRTDIAFVLVGQGRERDRLADRVKNESLENVTLINAIPKAQVPSMLAAIDICYIGLTADPLFRFGVSPNKLFDYLISGNPILYGIDSGEYKPVETFGAGIQVPPDDAEAVAQAVLAFAEMTEAERYELGAAGRRAALAHHEYGMLAEQLETVLLNPGQG
ncbi:glycosyltransferase family 4 protein [Roseovarius nubinhibens]|uniref:Glycosyltransferase WbuB n=1 Tax=Roseovarius nubinhibens TaxID=314263 RepID=A0A348WA08_9RHOB|nr:glycosyltransferase WbuB [Roseovarius nubinhibens]|tara:strand:- start:4204 stop:5433 length:1230 start_codon:yes stop_codon:yes gene_type:complete